MTKHGNISIEKTKSRYILQIEYESEIFLTADDIHDLEICLHKLRNLEITESYKRD